MCYQKKSNWPNETVFQSQTNNWWALDVRSLYVFISFCVAKILCGIPRNPKPHIRAEISAGCSRENVIWCSPLIPLQNVNRIRVRCGLLHILFSTGRFKMTSETTTTISRSTEHIFTNNKCSNVYCSICGWVVVWVDGAKNYSFRLCIYKYLVLLTINFRTCRDTDGFPFIWGASFRTLIE